MRGQVAKPHEANVRAAADGQSLPWGQAHEKALHHAWRCRAGGMPDRQELRIVRDI